MSVGVDLVGAGDDQEEAQPSIACGGYTRTQRFHRLAYAPSPSTHAYAYAHAHAHAYAYAYAYAYAHVHAHVHAHAHAHAHDNDNDNDDDNDNDKGHAYVNVLGGGSDDSRLMSGWATDGLAGATPLVRE